MGLLSLKQLALDLTLKITVSFSFWMNIKNRNKGHGRMEAVFLDLYIILFFYSHTDGYVTCWSDFTAVFQIIFLHITVLNTLNHFLCV